MAATDRDVLPDKIKPSHYDLSLYNLELGGAFTFQGTVKITIVITSPTKEILLNAHQLKVTSASVTSNSKSSKTSEIFYIESSQRVSLQFPEELPSASDATLSIDYSGIMNNDMAGFYRSRYKPEVQPSASVPKVGDFHFMFSTQFESCDARRAFPCFDEPNLKATFDVSIEIPKDLTALSNMPEKGTQEVKEGMKVVSFERTPVMSTYLLAWAFGDFEYVEGSTQREYHGKKLPVRVYTTRGLKDQGRWALENAGKVVDYFSEIFHIDYPLPKADLLAVHEFSHGAMENWGLVTYRTTAVLFDEKHSDAKYRVRVAYVVAHELAHQWFGNLVTMDWWSELWLNEGFATWVGWLAVDHLHPEYQVWTQFVTEAVQSAQNLDALRSSHPIEVPVKDALEIDQIFDAISYLKGSSVIRMLSNHLSVEVFLEGVSNYLKAHAYGNATTNDLWAALSKASGQDVNTFMDPWIRKIGFPVVTVAEEPGQLGIRQSRFLSAGDVQSSDDDTLWWIPLGLKTDPEDTGASPKALTGKEETLRNVDERFYKLNTEQTGFYRTNYPPARLASLGESKSKLSNEDKIGFIADAAALAISGDGTTAGLLNFVENFKDETSHAVWSQLIMSLSNVRSIFASNEAISTGLKAFTLRLVGSATENIGWDFKPDEDFLTGQLRALLIGTAGLAGHKARFDAYLKGEHDAIHPSLRLPIFRICVNEGGQTAYSALKNEYLNTKSIDGREICLQAMGRVQSTELARDFMNFQFGEHVAVQDAHTGSIALAQNAKTRSEVWKYVKEKWDIIYRKLSGNMVVLDRYVKTTLGKFASLDVERDIALFFKDKDQKGFDRGLVQVSDTITANARYKERDEMLVREWLSAHGYL
ncbi:MAG: hypothetical protein Q9191_007739 [Dirinaria sp. TL-2023a]